MEENKSYLRSPKQSRGINTKKQLVQAAMKLFSEKGYYKTNSKEIAKAAGLSTGCFYSYFEDKRAIFIEALKILFNQFNDVLDNNFSLFKQGQSDNNEFLRGIIRTIIDTHQMFVKLHNELVFMSFSDPEVNEMIHTQDKLAIHRIHQFLQKNEKEIKISDLEAASLILYKLIHGVVDSIIFSKHLEERLINEMTEMIGNYLYQ